jgi:hypothetical protein
MASLPYSGGYMIYIFGKKSTGLPRNEYVEPEMLNHFHDAVHQDATRFAVEALERDKASLEARLRDAVMENESLRWEIARRADYY